MRRDCQRVGLREWQARQGLIGFASKKRIMGAQSTSSTMGSSPHLIRWTRQVEGESTVEDGRGHLDGCRVFHPAGSRGGQGSP